MLAVEELVGEISANYFVCCDDGGGGGGDGGRRGRS